MFFCERCRERKAWPESMSRSYGRCELCQKSAESLVHAYMRAAHTLGVDVLPMPHLKNHKENENGS